MINLVPPSYKTKLKQEMWFRLLVILGSSFLIFLLSLALLFGLIRVYLGGEIASSESELRFLKEEFSREDAVVQELEKLHTKLAEIEKLQENQQEVSSVLEQLTQALPESLYLTSFSYTPGAAEKKKEEAEKIPAKIAVAGKAATRESLFSFREALQQNPLFQDLSFPPLNWVSPLDINFSFQATINP